MKRAAGALRVSRMDAERTEQPGCARAAPHHVRRWRRSPARTTGDFPDSVERTCSSVRCGARYRGSRGMAGHPGRRAPIVGGPASGMLPGAHQRGPASDIPSVRCGARYRGSPPGWLGIHVAGRPSAGPASDIPSVRCGARYRGSPRGWLGIHVAGRPSAGAGFGHSVRQVRGSLPRFPRGWLGIQVAGRPSAGAGFNMLPGAHQRGRHRTFRPSGAGLATEVPAGMAEHPGCRAPSSGAGFNMLPGAHQRGPASDIPSVRCGARYRGPRGDG